METKNIDSLKPDPKNPRRLSEHDGKSLQNSMDKFGDLGCIVFNIRTEQLVGGHQRLEIMKRLKGEPKVTITDHYDTPDEVGTVAIGYIWIGNKQFAYREVDWDEGTQRAANIAANRVQGEFDLDLLAQVNYEISLLDNGQDLLGLTGQTPNEVNDLLKMVSGKGTPDNDPEVDPEGLLTDKACTCPKCGFEFEPKIVNE